MNEPAQRSRNEQGEVYQIHGQDDVPLTIYAESTKQKGVVTWYRLPSWRVTFLGFEEFDLRAHRHLHGDGWVVAEATTGKALTRRDYSPETIEEACAQVAWWISKGHITGEKMREAITKAEAHLKELGVMRSETGGRTLPAEPTRAMLDAWSGEMLGVATHRPSTQWPGLHYSDSEARMVRAYQAMLNAAPQVPAMATSGVGVAEVDSPASNGLESATSVQAPIAEPCGAAPSSSDKHRAAEVLAKIEKAHKHVCDLAAGRERWTMRIPARPDMDSDLMIGDALDSARKLIESVAPSAEGASEVRAWHPDMFDAVSDFRHCVLQMVERKPYSITFGRDKWMTLWDALQSAQSHEGSIPYIDRSEAVNLARNVVPSAPDYRPGEHQITPKGIRCLAEAVLKMDEAIRCAGSAKQHAVGFEKWMSYQLYYEQNTGSFKNGLAALLHG